MIPNEDIVKKIWVRDRISLAVHGVACAALWGVASQGALPEGPASSAVYCAGYAAVTTAWDMWKGSFSSKALALKADMLSWHDNRETQELRAIAWETIPHMGEAFISRIVVDRDSDSPLYNNAVITCDNAILMGEGLKESSGPHELAFIMAHEAGHCLANTMGTQKALLYGGQFLQNYFYAQFAAMAYGFGMGAPGVVAGLCFAQHFFSEHLRYLTSKADRGFLSTMAFAACATALLDPSMRGMPLAWAALEATGFTHNMIFLSARRRHEYAADGLAVAVLGQTHGAERYFQATKEEVLSCNIEKNTLNKQLAWVAENASWRIKPVVYALKAALAVRQWFADVTETHPTEDQRMRNIRAVESQMKNRVLSRNPEP